MACSMSKRPWLLSSLDTTAFFKPIKVCKVQGIVRKASSSVRILGGAAAGLLQNICSSELACKRALRQVNLNGSAQMPVRWSWVGD